jgi:hypothetical protein
MAVTYLNTLSWHSLGYIERITNLGHDNWCPRADGNLVPPNLRQHDTNIRTSMTASFILKNINFTELNLSFGSASCKYAKVKLSLRLIN